MEAVHRDTLLGAQPRAKRRATVALGLVGVACVVWFGRDSVTSAGFLLQPLMANRAPAARSATPMMDAAIAVSAKEVKKLRDAAGAGMMDCKKALQENNGDFQAAAEFLRKKGQASADKKASRKAKEGIIETYIHTGAKLGVMAEVNCETDFVAKRPEFQELAKAIAMQIAANPDVEFVSELDVPQTWVAEETRIEGGAEDLQGKPQEIVDKIVAGRVQKRVKAKILLEQPYIRDPNINVNELVKSYIAKIGENIKVARFVRFNVGDGQEEEEEEDFAAEVEKMKR